MQLTGIHHLTAVSADAPGNKRFYTDTLGMRLVKKTVNQDEVSRLSSVLCRRPRAARHRPHFLRFPTRRASGAATHAITRTGLRIAGPESLHVVEGAARPGRREESATSSSATAA